MASFTRSDDLRGAEFVDVDLRGARFVRSDLSGVVMREADVHGADIDAPWLSNGESFLLVNGVDVIPLVEAELNRRFPGRADRHAATPDGLRAAWAALEGTWAGTLARVDRMPAGTVDVSVGGEWSFAQTLRHLVFAMDKWFTVPVLGGQFHPIGLPNTGSLDFGWPNLDYGQTPSVAVALAVRAGRAAAFRDYAARLSTADFTRPIEVLENGTNPLQECIYTVLEEEFWHHRYALRDLEVLEAAASRR